MNNEKISRCQEKPLGRFPRISVVMEDFRGFV